LRDGTAGVEFAALANMVEAWSLITLGLPVVHQRPEGRGRGMKVEN
jgi:hypothetical protein